MAFGAGVLVAALTFSLIEEAYNLVNDLVPVVLGFTLGGISYSIANYILNKKAAVQKIGSVLMAKMQAEGRTPLALRLW
jgi:ABC-type enterochelin transport system permease subunit